MSPRVYERRFDHEEARDRFLAGETQVEIAATYGVTAKAVHLAIKRLDPVGRAADNEYKRLYQQEHLRKPCVRGCGRMAWHQTGRSGVCFMCAAFDKATTVRAATLLCVECGDWKPDAEFPHALRKQARRGRHALCRGCQTKAKRAYRDARKIPCVECGQPRLPHNLGNGSRGNDTGLCLDCYQANREKTTHCIRGHKRTPDNVAPGGECRKCKRIRDRARYRKNVA